MNEIKPDQISIENLFFNYKLSFVQTHHEQYKYRKLMCEFLSIIILLPLSIILFSKSVHFNLLIFIITFFYNILSYIGLVHVLRIFLDPLYQ